ncbi:hypothetical protein H4W80_002649 [Nonomuraea angiospora]|uniref:Uncharacterized protein n=1 Tax=Nonomuraea angiospora TaxID=46172 RepID=A0ABR9LUR3_9ACTN|nr:hypothetical protein [Nonomuraea angiospora]
MIELDLYTNAVDLPVPDIPVTKIFAISRDYRTGLVSVGFMSPTLAIPWLRVPVCPATREYGNPADSLG